MKVVFTKESLISLRETLNLIRNKVGRKKVEELRKRILDKADSLVEAPNIGQKEECLAHLDQAHRRVIEGHYKIIYIIKNDSIIITDVFDSRQNPESMKG